MIRWINERLGTGAFDRVLPGDYEIIDVRELVDKDGNQPDSLRRMIDRVVQSLKSGHNTVVCCDFGISRSNSIAAAALATFQGITLDEAIAIVVQATDEREIKLEMIASLRRAMEGESLPDPTNILITGAGGTIGKPLREKLQSHFRILPFYSADGDLTESVRELEAVVVREKIGQIIHLANPRVNTSSVALGKSLNMLKNVLDVCREHHLKLVYPSGWVVFSGYDSTSLRVTEDIPMRPQGAYAEAKMLAELLIDHFVAAHGLRCLKLRLCSIYSAACDKPRFLRTFIKKAMAGEDIISHEYRNGPPRMELLHLDDLVELFAIAVQNDLDGCYHIGGSDFLSTLDIAEIIIGELKSASRIRKVAIDSNAPNIILDDRKLFGMQACQGLIKRSAKNGIIELVQSHQNLS